MIYIDKSNRCTEFDEYVNNDSLSDWVECKTEIKLKLHQHLWSEQQGLCIYCQQEIPKKKQTEASSEITSHIEHIRPRRGVNSNKYAHLQFCYNNLSVSCEGFDCKSDERKKEFCEHRKNNEYDESKFLNPVECSNIEDYFIYDINGNIHPNLSKNQESIDKAEYMIKKVLHLNNPILKKMRQRQYDLVMEEQLLGINIEEYLEPDYDLLPSFYSMLKQLFL